MGGVPESSPSFARMGDVTDEQSGYPGAPPGWYGDPAGGAGQRWWDGYAWTDTVVLPTPPPPPPPTGFAQVSGGYAQYAVGADPNSSGALFQREAASFRLARIGVVVPAAVLLINLIYEQANRAQLRTLGHQFHVIYVAAQHGQSAPAFSQNINFDPLSPLLLLFEVLAIVACCIWQHRAATTARSLGLPSTHSPGWGVGSWFVPVVYLWMPYQAIRDCLAPNDPNRLLVLRWWLLVVFAEIFNFAALITGMASEHAGLILAIPAALLALGQLATAPRVVTAVTSAHRALIEGAVS
jgi:Domain of unknown function (DUF4328)/Protein of unknown function (DUF2510)